MLIDLLAKDIQPPAICIQDVPDLEISGELRQKLYELLEKEEKKYVNILEKTSIIQTNTQYVFMSNQWLYLAVLCKKYAEALYPYCDFFDKKIGVNTKIVRALSGGKYDLPEFTELFSDSVEKDRMTQFIEGEPFRPGKSIINNYNGNITPRSGKDVFGSCILSKIDVPNASSSFLGYLIYYLAENPDIYALLEEEVNKQLPKHSFNKKLSSKARSCAKEIVDCIYEIDKFERISSLFTLTGKYVKIDSDKTEENLLAGNVLRYMFALPSSESYADRTFPDTEYRINVDGKEVGCRLTTEWKGGQEYTETDDGNLVGALIDVVNRYYAGIIDIKNEAKGMYLYFIENKFMLSDLPDAFQNDFSRRYITSLLAKPFVILTGNSGTGKTRIAKQFAEYMELIDDESEKNWIIVPVGADWTDNSKIIGFYNPLGDDGKGKYETTGIIELIERANVNTNIPYFLILDEMNLSQVEQYFSDFLSHMETQGSVFEIDGYNRKIDEHSGESDGFKKELRFPENLFVVGTVNIDETTYMFSPKVLDRANVVEFKPDREDVLKLFIEPADDSKIKPANNGMPEAFLKLAMAVRNHEPEVDMAKDEMPDVQDIFDEVYKKTEHCGFEFAYRTVKEIRQYITAAFNISDKSQTNLMIRSIDEQLLQKILPKIHGNKKELGDLLDDLENLCDEKKLELSGEKIKQMKGKLANTQYASFI